MARGAHSGSRSSSSRAPAPLPVSLDARAMIGRRVLIVDDNQTSRSILLHQLERWGMRCVAAADALQALRLMQEGVALGDPFALVLVDMQMPGMDGSSLAATIKHDPFLRQVDHCDALVDRRCAPPRGCGRRGGAVPDEAGQGRRIVRGPADGVGR